MANKLIFKKSAMIHVRVALPIKHLKAVTMNWKSNDCKYIKYSSV